MTGKRLGAISKQAKEAKCAEREVQERKATKSEEMWTTMYFVGVVVVLGALTYLGYQNKGKLTGNKKGHTGPPSSSPPKKSNCVFAKQ